MSWKDYPALSERCYLETLPNGLRLRVVPKPGFAGKFAFLGVNFGSCDTQLPQSGGWQTVPDGTAHFSSTGCSASRTATRRRNFPASVRSRTLLPTMR